MTTRFKGFFNQSGGTELLALAIATAIGAVVISATTTSFVNLNQGQQNVVKTADALDIKRDIEQLLSHAETCKANFGNLPANGASRDGTLVQIDAAGASTNKFAMDQTIPGFNIKIRNWSLTDGPIIRQSTATQAAQRIVFLNLTIDKGTGVTGPSTITRTVKLWTQKENSTTSDINFCYALIGTGNDIWLRHVDPDNIFNSNDGNVGVGTDTPLAKLHVTNPDPATANMRASGAVTSPTFNASANFVQAASAAPHPDNSIMGRLGIGVLTPTSPIHGSGNAMFVGDMRIEGNITAPSVILQSNLAVGTNLDVGGTTNLGAMTVNGDARFLGASVFNGNSQINGSTTMAQTYSVGGARIGTSMLSVHGSMRTNNLVTAPSRVEANSFCIGPNCRTTFATQTCPVGRIAVRNLVSGLVECSDINCAVGQFLRGVNGINAPDCQALPTPICATNEYITNYDAVTGVYTCRPIPPEVHVPSCPSGYLVGVINGVQQCRPVALVGAPPCGPGLAVVDIDTDGSPICDSLIETPVSCGAGQLVTGIQYSGAPTCASVAQATTCTSNGERLGSIDSGRAGDCDPVSITGGSCPSGIKGISSNGTVTCF